MTVPGNFRAIVNDYCVVICDDVRLSLSAQLDGELTGPVPEQRAAHLAGCADCRQWQVDAARLAGLVGPAAVEVPDLTERIMAAVAHDSASRRAASAAPAPRYAADRYAADQHAAESYPASRYAASRYTNEDLARERILRLAVAAAAVVQLALAVPALVSAFIGPGSGVGLHASREMASFDVAVAIGFLLAAARPDRARVFLPVAVVLAGCLAATSGIDLARGATVVSHEIGHLVALVQAGLLWALSRGRPPATGVSPGGNPGEPGPGAAGAVAA